MGSYGLFYGVILGVTLGLGLGFGVGYSTRSDLRSPMRVYHADLNKDGIQDTIVRTRGENYIFMGQNDGTYVALPEYKSRELRQVSELADEQRAAVEKNIGDIEAAAKDIK